MVRIVRATPWLYAALQHVRADGPPGAYIAAGSVRDTVWSALCGLPCRGPHADVDVVYHGIDGPPEAEVVERLRRRAPELPWEVTNQATVHHWLKRQQGLVRPAFRSIAEGVASWPETATAVGIRLLPSGRIAVLAPLGLEDLLALRLRPNPAGPPLPIFEQRVVEKGWLHRFPRLSLELETG